MKNTTITASNSALTEPRRTGIRVILAPALAVGCALALLATPSLAGDTTVSVGEVEVIGRGCGPIALTTDTNSRAFPGNNSFHVLVEGMSEAGAVGLLLAASNDPRVAHSLPIDLTSIGLAGCELYLVPDVVLLQIESGDGITPFHLPVPNDPGLTGTSFTAQGFAVEARSGAVSMAHGIDVVIGG